MLPKDKPTLQALAGVSPDERLWPDFNARWLSVERMFPDRGEYLANDRQLSSLAKQEIDRENAMKAGHASALARERKRKQLQISIKELVAQSNGRSTESQRNGNEQPTLLTPTPISELLTSYSPPTPNGERKRKGVSVSENTPLMVTMGLWFGRRAATLWAAKEAQRLTEICGAAATPPDMDVMAAYYTAKIQEKDDIRRRDLYTLLNNWTGEADRARRYILGKRKNNPFFAKEIQL